MEGVKDGKTGGMETWQRYEVAREAKVEMGRCPGGEGRPPKILRLSAKETSGSPRDNR